MRNSMRTTVVLLVIGWVLVGIPATGEDLIKVGAVMPLTGVFGFAGGPGNAGGADVFGLTNEEGGINGKRIEYIVEDGTYNVNVAVPKFRKIIEDHHPLVMLGESTELGKMLSPEIKERYKVLYGSTSFSSELANVGMNPYVYVAGPTYGDMFAILLKYIAKEHPRAKVAFFYSDTAFGKDPIKYGRLMCEKLRLNLVTEVVAQLGQADLKDQLMELKAKDPDYVIVQGFLVDPIPQVMKACRDMGMKCTFMGTFWGATKIILDKLGPLADGYMAVNPYMYWWNDDVPMVKKLREYTAKHHPDVQYRDNFYMQGVVNALIAVECLRRADKAKELNGEGLVKALQSLNEFETGGLMAPVSIKNNRFPIARVWKANVEKKIYEQASDWIRLDRY